MEQRSDGERRFIEAIRHGFADREEQAITELRALIREAEASNDDDAKGWIIAYEARFLGQMGRVYEARERFVEVRRLWTRTPEHDSRIAVGEAILFEIEGDPNRTLEELDRILKEYSDKWDIEELKEPYEEIQANRGRLLARQGRWKEALPLLEETLRSEKGKWGEFYYNLGHCYFLAQDWDKSERWLTVALTKQLTPGFASATHYLLGRLAYRKEDFEHAVEEYRAAEDLATEAGTDSREIHAGLVWSYHKLGLKDEALRYRRRYDSTRPN